MARITIEDCLDKEENRFVLVHMAAQRVRQLVKGSTPFVDSPENGDVVVALREIAAGKILVPGPTSPGSDDIPQKMGEEEVWETEPGS